MAEPFVIFGHAVEGLIKLIRPRMNERLQTRLRDSGLDVTRRPEPTYPFSSWREWLRICREELYPGPEAEMYRRFGSDFTGSYFETPFGAALAGIVRLLGPVRTLKRATQNFRSANNFTECRVQELGPGYWELWMNHVDNNDFNVGIVTKALQIAGVKQVQAEILPGPDYSATFRIRWQ